MNKNSLYFFDRPIRYLILLMMSLAGLVIGLNYSNLPEDIPVFFNYPMAENGYGNKQSLWELLILFSLIITFVFWLIKISKNHIYSSIPLIKRPDLGYKIAREMLCTVALFLSTSCLILIIITVYSAKGIILNGEEILYPSIPILLIFGPLFYLGIALMKSLKKS